jgi:hypothetical protein
MKAGSSRTWNRRSGSTVAKREPYYPLAVTNVGPQVIVTVPAGCLRQTLNLAEAGALHTALTISLRLAEAVVVEATRGKNGR